ncbi:MAG: amidohydrolase [Chloroflexota bacterium]
MTDDPRVDLVLTGGRIWTGGERPRPADTLVVADGRIAGLGQAHELRWALPVADRVIRLEGRVVLPAFQDASVHPVAAGLAMTRPSLAAAADPTACRAILADWLRTDDSSGWLVGDGWTPSAFPGGIPRAADLDAVVPDRPAVLLSADGSAAWVNAAAMELAGIREDTPDPAAGRIERDGDGQPLGMLVGRAVDLVTDLLPPPGLDDLADGLLRAQAHLHALGVGGWRDAAAGPAEEAAYLALHEHGRLTAKVALTLAWDERRWVEQLPEIRARADHLRRTTGGRVRAGSVALRQDGPVATGMAALLDPYLDARGRMTHDRGPSILPPDVLRELVVAIDRARLGVLLQAHGDRAVREALDAFTAVRLANGPREGRHAIVGLQLVQSPDLVRFDPLGVVATCLPRHAVDDVHTRTAIRPLLGLERTSATYPFGSLARNRASLALGSGWPGATADPRDVLDAALTRIDPHAPGGKPLGPVSERLKTDAALRAYSRGAAWAARMDDVTGTLEVGRPADLVVMEGDPLTDTALAWRDTRVLLTVVDGRPVFEASGLAG